MRHVTLVAITETTILLQIRGEVLVLRWTSLRKFSIAWKIFNVCEKNILYVHMIIFMHVYIIILHVYIVILHV